VTERESLPASCEPFQRECGDDSTRVVEVVAASRLHFGLLSWGGNGRQFGGVGLMVQAPRVALRVRAADHFEATGPHAERVTHFARKWYESRGGLAQARTTCDVLEAPPQHVGLGLGTQLALSLGAALCQFEERRWPTPAELALRLGRGLRSAVGTYGFFQGGLIFESGKLPEEGLAPQAERHAVPDSWRVVLIQPTGAVGEAGDVERRAFASLPAVPEERTRQLLAIVRERLLPAIERADCLEFGQAVYDYGRLAGECFAPWQGGPFNGPLLMALVEKIRGWGYAGVGQSSWGPTLFVILESEAEAQALSRRLRAEPEGLSLNLTVTRPANAGARVQELSGVRFAHG